MLTDVVVVQSTSLDWQGQAVLGISCYLACSADGSHVLFWSGLVWLFVYQLSSRAGPNAEVTGAAVAVCLRELFT